MHLEYKEQGDHHVLTATINRHPYMACGWSDSTRNHFISTHNTPLEGNPHGKRRWRETDSDDVSGTGGVHSLYKEAQGSRGLL